MTGFYFLSDGAPWSGCLPSYKITEQVVYIIPNKTGKQHGLAGSTNPFLNHISPSPGGKTSRLDPLKNYTVAVKLCRFPCNFPTKRIRDQGFEALKVSLQFPTKRTRHHGFQAAGARNHGFLTKTEASKRESSMAWPVQRTRF